MAALLVTLVACGEQSRVDPDAAITVTGVVADPGGAAAVGRPVRLGTGVSVGDGALAVLTVGLSCTSGACRGNVRDATTDGTGRYSFELKGADTQSTFGEAESVLVSATGSPTSAQVSGPLASARFQVQTALVDLPPLELVDPSLTIEGAGAVTARWTSPRPGPFELTFENGEQVPVWLSRTAESSASLDPRLLEDTAGRVVISGGYEEAIEGSKVDMRWRSPGLPYAAGAGAPPSRGSSCLYVDAAGGVAEATDGCDLTDGDLASSGATPPVCAASDATACETAVAVVINLDPPVPAELIVVRGCEAACPVQVSADGASFRAAGSAAGEFGTVAADGQMVRAVRVGVEAVTGLREVSVWGPAPVMALRSLTDGERDDLADPYGAPSGRDGRSPWVLLAAVLAAMVAFGAVVVAYRRQRARELA